MGKDSIMYTPQEPGSRAVVCGKCGALVVEDQRIEHDLFHARAGA